MFLLEYFLHYQWLRTDNLLALFLWYAEANKTAKNSTLQLIMYIITYVSFMQIKINTCELIQNFIQINI